MDFMILMILTLKPACTCIMYVISIWGGSGNIFYMMAYCYYVFLYRCTVFLLSGFFSVQEEGVACLYQGLQPALIRHIGKSERERERSDIITSTLNNYSSTVFRICCLNFSFEIHRGWLNSWMVTKICMKCLQLGLIDLCCSCFGSVHR